VPQQDEQKLFQPFFTTKPVGSGTGLGLSVSYGIIDAYSGATSYFNNEWGGATFFVELPAAGDAAARIERMTNGCTTRTRIFASLTRRSSASIAGTAAPRSSSIARLSIPPRAGQPFDVGTIGDPERVAPQTEVGRPFQGRLHVIDVVDDDTGEIAHLVDGDAPKPGDRVHGAIDWTRRFDHMQQHTGQHVLSAAIDRLSASARSASISGRTLRRSISRAS